ncbi:MAG: PDR/VanB family oxidoreductase [Hydrogenophaga sp.]|nr:PDR/VanB family oxidoreductase [Hydrogenophaga sp.]
MTYSRDLLRVRVSAVADEAQGIRSFELVDEGGGALPAFSAGAHIDVTPPGGPTRQYSLCNNPSERHRYLIAVQREPASRGGSVSMHERVNVGDLLTISAPKNHFPLAQEGGSNLLLAAGIGVTPILSMAERLHAAGADFRMHYCTRSKQRTAFHQRITKAPYAAKVSFHFGDGEPAQRFDVTAQMPHPESGTHLYVCGPSGFMEAVLTAARARNWPESHVHREYFGASVQPIAADEGFEVVAARTGTLVMVPPGKTVLQALAEAGIEVPFSCEQGVCGTCLTRVVDGTPEHRDMYLTPDEQAANDRFMPCCSRSVSRRLVLDL